MGEAGRAVARAVQRRGDLGEHDRVPGLIAELGERVLRVRAARVEVVDVAGQQLHEDDLEPQPDGHPADDLVLGQLDPLFLGELVPQLRAVERDVLQRHVRQPGHGRLVPVDLGQRVERVLGRGVEQPVRGELPFRDWRGGSCCSVRRSQSYLRTPILSDTRCTSLDALHGTPCTTLALDSIP